MTKSRHSRAPRPARGVRATPPATRAPRAPLATPAFPELQGVRYLSTEQLAEKFGIPAETWKRHRRTGDGPPWFRFGKHVRYPEDLAAAWVKSRLVHPAA